VSSDDWCSPLDVVVPLHRFYPRFAKTGLDPYSNANSIVGAARSYTVGGHVLPWDALEIYDNPAYSDLLRATRKAVAEVKLRHRGKVKELVCLVPVAPSTEWWQIALTARPRPPLLAYTKRLPFLDENGMPQTTARFDTVLQVWARSARREEEFCDLFAPIIRTVVHARHHTFPAR
jgi:hypothetical protein